MALVTARNTGLSGSLLTSLLVMLNLPFTFLEGSKCAVPRCFAAFVKSRIALEYWFYAAMKNLEVFEWEWCILLCGGG